MTITSASIDDPSTRGYANPPRLRLGMDALPDFTYEVLERGNRSRIFWAEANGLVQFYMHNPQNETGFGGCRFLFTLTSGARVEVKGPWSSRSSVMNDLGFPHSVECEVFTQDGDSHHLSVLVSTARDALAAHCPDWVLEQDPTDDETSYRLVRSPLARMGDD